MIIIFNVKLYVFSGQNLVSGLFKRSFFIYHKIQLYLIFNF